MNVFKNSTPLPVRIGVTSTGFVEALDETPTIRVEPGKTVVMDVERQELIDDAAIYAD